MNEDWISPFFESQFDCLIGFSGRDRSHCSIVNELSSAVATTATTAALGAAAKTAWFAAATTAAAAAFGATTTTTTTVVATEHIYRRHGWVGLTACAAS